MATLKPVIFHDVAIGHFFKDRADGTWHLKTAADRAMYQAADVRDDPHFLAEETVYIDHGEAKVGKMFYRCSDIHRISA